MSTKTRTEYPTITITEFALRAALDEFDPVPIVCEKCQVCALQIRAIRPGLIEGLCGCCAARWLLEVVR